MLLSCTPQKYLVRREAIGYQAMGRGRDALAYLNMARTLFGRLDARRDLVDVATRINQVVRAALQAQLELQELGQRPTL